MFRALLVALTCAFAAACSWVAVERGAEEVLVLPESRLGAGCESLGMVKVSVLDKVGVLERHDEEVIQDLNVLARNHAAKVGGDTAVPRGEVVNGERRYEIFRCVEGSRDTDTPRRGQSQPGNNVEVVPYDGGSDG